MNNDISAFCKGVFRCCRQLVIVYMLIVQYFSVKCAVLMHLSFTCITLMTDVGSCVFVYMFPTLNVMGHGSHIRWVNGSWVNSNDPLPALTGSTGRMVCYMRIGGLLAPLCTQQIAGELHVTPIS